MQRRRRSFQFLLQKENPSKNELNGFPQIQIKQSKGLGWSFFHLGLELIIQFYRYISGKTRITAKLNAKKLAGQS